jgi:hypothetical protein
LEKHWPPVSGFLHNDWVHAFKLLT